VNVKVTLEKVEAARVKVGAKPYRAHIVGRDFDHHAEADSPSEALLLAAARWRSYADKHDLQKSA
jgi:hypothetical protein